MGHNDSIPETSVYSIFCIVCLIVCFVALRPSQQLWSLRDGQFT